MKCYVLKINLIDHFMFWCENSSGYSITLKEAGIYDLNEFRKKRSEFSIPYIDSIEKYEALDISRHHSIIIPISFLDKIGYTDWVFKSKDVKHPRSRRVEDES